MNLLTEDEWNNLRNDFISQRLSQNLTIRFSQMFEDNEEVIPMINYNDLTPGQKAEAWAIYIEDILELDGGRKSSRSKKYKRTRRRQGSKKRRRGRKSRRYR
jgi:hypothetical protein